MHIQGKNNISAKIIADSISPEGIRMTTMELEYPRFILAELNTHRMLSKNSASSRAIPIKAMHTQINNTPAMPVYWGENQSGMQAAKELTGPRLSMVKYIWNQAKIMALKFAAECDEHDLHKQIANRITEPWMMMRTVVSGTEWSNLYHLRCHKDAQPEFKELAECAYTAQSNSVPTLLYPGEWHLPYVRAVRDSLGKIYYQGHDGEELSQRDACIVSASCCAQVSYRKNDDTLEKAKMIFDKLINSTPAHASPVEHQATPMSGRYAAKEFTRPEHWSEGITHMDANSDYWSGNLRGWVQYRKLIPNEAVWGVVPSKVLEEVDSV